MNNYVIFYGKEHIKAIDFMDADDDPQLLHKLGDMKVLDKVESIVEVRQLRWDIAYYQEPE